MQSDIVETATLAAGLDPVGEGTIIAIPDPFAPTDKDVIIVQTRVDEPPSSSLVNDQFARRLNEQEIELEDTMPLNDQTLLLQMMDEFQEEYYQKEKSQNNDNPMICEKMM